MAGKRSKHWKVYTSDYQLEANHQEFCAGTLTRQDEETRSGEIVTWGKVGKRWDLGERNVLEGLAEFGLKDVYRFKHGYRVQDFSWYARPHFGRRYDHIFASPSLLNEVECKYIHSLREKRLSDHSAITANFVLTS